MALKHQKSITIYRLFLKYLLGLAGAIIGLILLTILAGSFALQSGILLPANFSALQLSQIEESLTENFSPALLPPYCGYMILDENGEILENNMHAAELNKAKTYLSNGERSYYDFYKIIRQPNHNMLIIRYDLLAHFQNPILHKVIPRPEIFILLVLLGLIVLSTAITASKFSRKLKKNLAPIVAATEKIKHQDLDFEVTQTKISDFNVVLETIDQLKSALSASLKEQWDMEQQKKFQLSALTHDIKTPLTVIKGNAELLLEGTLCAEDRQFLSDMRAGADTIENYLELLMHAVNSDALQITKQDIPLETFLDDLSAQAAVLCKTKNIELRQRIHVKCHTIYADAALLKRAIINLIDNAVCYSRPGSQIMFSVWERETSVVFNVVDCGKGFSAHGFQKATQAFFTEDRARANHHYGLGLSFAKSVAQIHNGVLTLQNDAHTKGANVSIEIRKQSEQAGIL